MKQASRSSPLARIFLTLSVLALGVVGTVGVLWYLEKIELPFLSRTKTAPPPPPGTVPILLSVKDIPAYSKITREDLFDAVGKPRLFYLSPKEIEERGLIADFNKIVGRVVSHDVKKGYGFREKDLLPDGTRPGVAGGVPPGKRALVIEATKIQGIHALKAGDHIDLIARIMIDAPRNVDKNLQNVLAVSGDGSPKKLAVVKALVQNGYVVQPVMTRQSPSTSSSLTQGQKTQMKPVQEIVIAVDPKEVAPLTQALGTGAEVTAAYRSAQPNDSDATTITPGTPPPPPVTSIEIIRAGGKRDFAHFAGTKGNSILLHDDDK